MGMQEYSMWFGSMEVFLKEELDRKAGAPQEGASEVLLSLFHRWEMKSRNKYFRPGMQLSGRALA